MSSFRKHHAKCVAKSAASIAADSSQSKTKSLNVYERYMGQLTQHSRQLKTVQSREKKIEIKKGLVGEYDDYIDGVIASDSSAQNQILPTLMVWNIDVGNYDRALAIGEYCLIKDIAMPNRFERTIAAVLSEEIADASLKGKGVDLETVETVIEITQSEDMHDEIRAKLHKAAGLLLKEDDVEKAAQHLQRALSLDDGCGVKKILESVKKQLSSA